MKRRSADSVPYRRPGCRDRRGLRNRVGVVLAGKTLRNACDVETPAVSETAGQGMELAAPLADAQSSDRVWSFVTRPEDLRLLAIVDNRSAASDEAAQIPEVSFETPQDARLVRQK